MNQKEENDPILPDWPTEHSASIDQLSRSDTNLGELYDDHARLIKAIKYWTGRSEDRAEEFRCMARALQHEIVSITAQERYK